ncbi:microtubule-associated protein Jupiter-like [Tachypleus tridentatus]|uniref:microtubule-associated protein Jupiter-like n=1 Tax=Tachypleus tridentatus TaxID=6853 RepID=UPI003FD6A234
MSSIQKFYHVEIDKVGNGKKRITNSPGRSSSDIFGNINDQDEQKPQKKKNPNMYSSFYGSEDDSSNNNAIQRRSSWHTQSNLFGTYLTDIITPRKVVDRMKSNVFDGSEPVTKPYNAKKYSPVRRNPVTGEVYDDASKQNGYENGHANITESPNTGVSNGDPVSPAQTSVRVRIPPGGKSSGIF